MRAVAHALERVRGDLRHPCEPAGTTGCTAGVLPPSRRSSRDESANGVSPTEPATWPDTRRRWHVAIGALAVVASATTYLVTREADLVDSAATPAHASEPAGARDATRAPTPRSPTPTAEPPRAPAPPSPPPRANDPALEAPRATTLVGDIAIAATGAPAIEPAVMRGSAKPRAHPLRKAPVKPRRSPPIDPDGTVDPYR
jgi:hypothetical protein